MIPPKRSAHGQIEKPLIKFKIQPGSSVLCEQGVKSIFSIPFPFHFKHLPRGLGRKLVRRCSVKVAQVTYAVSTQTFSSEAVCSADASVSTGMGDSSVLTGSTSGNWKNNNCSPAYKKRDKIHAHWHCFTFVLVGAW